MKSHVAVEQKCCPVCGKIHDVGVLIHRRLAKVLLDKVVSGYGLCPEHQKLWEDGYVALVACNPPKDGSNPNISTADRTGLIIHVRKSVTAQIFNMPIDGPMAFIDPEAAELIRQRVEA